MNKKGVVNSKRGQSQISFGMIFSILLIIFFVAFAIYGVIKFLEVQKLAQVAKFKSDFQADITKMWQSTQGSQPETYYLPKGIKQVCFATTTNPKTGKDENMYFTPDDQYKKYGGYLFNNLNIAKTTAGSTGYPKKLCIDVINGKISMTLKKEYNENTVTITK